METKQLDNSTQVFRCDNLSLAIALSALGCAFASEGKYTIAGLNQYTLAFIRSHPMAEKCKGMSHEDAVRFLWRAGQPGNIAYYFQRSPVLSAVCEGWDEQGANGDVPSDLVTEAKDAGRIARRLAQTRVEFIGSKEVTPLWRRKDADGNLFVPAIAHTPGTVGTESTGNKSTRTTLRDAKMRGVQV